MIISVQLLRFVAAFFVVLAHSLGEYEWAKPFGNFGVDIFFVISGFIIYVITDQNTNFFFTRRLIRIIPMYWLFTLVICFVAYFQPNLVRSTTFDVNHIITSLFFFPYWIEGAGFFPILRLGWTLNFEMFFYLIFYFSMQLSHKHRAILTSLVMILMVMILNSMENFSEKSFLNFYSTTIWFEFIFGMAIGIFYKNFNGFKMEIQSTVILTLLLIGLIGLMSCIEIFGNSSYTRTFKFGLPSSLLLIVILNFETVFFRANTAIKKMILWLGEMSYPLYLIHMYCIAMLHRVLFQEIEFWLLFPIALFLSLLLSYVVSWLYDNPLRKWFSSKLLNYQNK